MTEINSSAAIRTGLFVIGGLIVLFIGVSVFGGRDLFRREVVAVVHFEENLSGLSAGSPVTFRGVQIGEVRSVDIEVDTQVLKADVPVVIELHPDRIRFTDGPGSLSDRAELDRAVSAGLRAQLADESFVTGQKRVELVLKPDAPLRRRAQGRLPEIPAVTSELGILSQQLRELELAPLVEETEATLRTIRQLAETLKVAAPPLLDSAQRTSDEAGVTLRSARRAVDTLEGEGAQTLRSLRRLSDTTSVQVSDRGQEVAVVLEDTRRLAERLDRIAADVEGMTAVGVPLRTDVETAARDLSASAAHLRAFARELEDNPQALLLGRRP